MKLETLKSHIIFRTYRFFGKEVFRLVRARPERSD